MTQNAGMLAPQSKAPVKSGGDAPDILFVLRHYMWLIASGTVLGFGLSIVIFFFCLKYYPTYQAQAQFQVKPRAAANMITADNQTQSEPTKDDIERTIRRQILLVRSDRVLDLVLKDSDAFKHFREENPVLPKYELKKILETTPVPNTDVFQISMKGYNPEELAKQVNAIADTYYEELRQIEAAERSIALADVQTAQKTLEKSVLGLSEGLEEFKSSHDITAITQAYQVKMSTLSSLTTELVKAQTESTGAKANLEMVKKQVETGTLQLPGEYEQFIENDPSLRALENSKLQLDQELAVNILQYGKQHRSSISIQTRIDETQRQIDEMRSEKRNKARVLMQEGAQSALNVAQAKEQDLLARRDSLDRELKDLDKWLVEYKSRNTQLESQQLLLSELSREATLKQLSNRSDVQRVSRFTVATIPDSKDIVFPLAKIFLPVGAVLGLLLSFGVGYLRELMNTKLRSPRDVSHGIQVPLLGFVPDRDDDAFLEGDIATSIRTSPGSLVAESYRLIRGRLAAQASGQPFKTLLVASAAPGGGATTVASNLANGVALNGQRVLLIDANFYRPGLGKLYNNLPKTGLSDVIAGHATVENSVAVNPELSNLSLMSAGSLMATSASELLEGRGFKTLLEQVTGQYDLIIFDGAPLNLVSDSLTLGSKLDGVVTVVRAGVTTRGTVNRVRDQLRQVHARLLGIVLNAAKIRGAGYFKQNYRSFYEYAGPMTPRLPIATPTTPAKVK